jgi:hypothetical protein
MGATEPSSSSGLKITSRASFFSTALIDGLRGAAANASGLVTGDSLRAYLQARFDDERRRREGLAFRNETYSAGNHDIVIVEPGRPIA